MSFPHPAQRMIILTAPSGAGKTTMAAALLRRLPVLAFSVSATTRAPRAGEQDGRDYYFLSVDAFRQKIAEGAFLEYEMVYEGKYYGTLYAELERIWRQGRCPLRVVDVTGALALKEKFGPEALSIFIQPPSLASLKERLTGRGTEDPGSLEERLGKAAREMEAAPLFDHAVVNDELPRALAEAEALITAYLQDKAMSRPR